MAKLEKFAGKLLNLEKGYVNNPSDKGGPTKYGVILSTWKEYGYDKNDDGVIDLEDIKLLTPDDAKFVAKSIFWDFFRADEIHNQSLADLIVDWGYNSGRSTVAKHVQAILKTKIDGVFGKATIDAINNVNQKSLFEAIKNDRKTFIEAIVRNRPDQHVFYNGWMNRVNSFFFCLDGKELD